MWWLFLAEETLVVAADTGHRGSDVPTQGPEQKGQVGAWLAMLSGSFQPRGWEEGERLRLLTESRQEEAAPTPTPGLSSARRR